MARALGMDPSRVESLAARLSTQHSRLTQVTSTVNLSVMVSQNPLLHGVMPGGLVISPYSVATVQHAAAQVQSALSAADRLIAKLLREADEQRRASDAMPTDIGLCVDPGLKLPGWLNHAAWGWLGKAFEAYSITEGLITAVFGNKKVFQFMRKQRAGRSGFRYRGGLLQFGRSSYKNNPVAFKYREPKSPKWITSVRKAAPKWLAKTTKVLGPVATAIGGVTTAFTAYRAEYDQSANRDTVDRHVHAAAVGVSNGATNIAVGAAAAWGGAQIGAAIGSVFPGPGTAIGAVVGGVVGVIASTGIAEKAGNKVGEWIGSLW